MSLVAGVMKMTTPIKYLQDKGFRITSNPHEYYQSYNPNRGKKPFGKRDLFSYGQNVDSYCGGYHRAWDFAKAHNAAIPAIANAKVLNGTGWNTFGWTLVLGFFDAKGKHYQVIYGHLNKNPLTYLKVGQTVKQGVTVAYQGSSNNIGANMASHLHIQWQPFGALNERQFTCNGIDALKIDVSKTDATKAPDEKKQSAKNTAPKKVKITENLSHNKNHAGSGNPMNFITIHQTANTAKGANAQAHANFINNGSAATWHYTVDDKHAIQHFYETTRCFHAGDGTGKGNYQSIGIEMCVNSDGDYNQTLANAASLVADILKRRNLTTKDIVSHGYWTGKNCPTQLLAGKNGITWNDFKKMVQNGGGVVSSGSKPSKSKPAQKSGGWNKNKHGTFYKPEKGTFTVGGTRIMSREGSPFLSAPEGGWCHPKWPIRYDELCKQDGHLWIGYTQNGKRWYLPIRTWNAKNDTLGKMWGTAKLGW